MKAIKFTKMVASGNDFIIVDNNSKLTAYSSCLPAGKVQLTAKKICDRKFAVGADGLLVLEKSKLADIKMRIFNADGSEAEMCGNGARCVALWAKSKVKSPCLSGRQEKSKVLKIETKAGIIEAVVGQDNVNPVRNNKALRGINKISNGVKIRLTNPKDIKLDVPIRVNNRTLRVNFINTGVPHTVIFVEGLDKIDVFNLGREIRYHQKFVPRGTNVDFVEVLSSNSIKIRTYERGVEDETLACGTGAAASALILATCYSLLATYQVDVLTKSGEILKVYFDRLNDSFKNVWLEGKAKIVYQGVYYV